MPYPRTVQEHGFSRAPTAHTHTAPEVAQSRRRGRPEGAGSPPSTAPRSEQQGAQRVLTVMHEIIRYAFNIKSESIREWLEKRLQERVNEWRAAQTAQGYRSSSPAPGGSVGQAFRPAFAEGELVTVLRRAAL